MQPQRTANDEFVSLFVANQRRIHGFIATLLPNTADAEEVLQTTSMVAWRKFGEFVPGTDFVRWVCTIARFEVHNYLREKKRSRLIFDNELLEDLAQRQTAASGQLEQRHSALAACMQKLRDQDRDLLRRCYAENATFKQVAAQLRRPANTVYKALKRIRSALMVCVDRTLAREGHA